MDIFKVVILPDCGTGITQTGFQLCIWDMPLQNQLIPQGMKGRLLLDLPKKESRTTYQPKHLRSLRRSHQYMQPLPQYCKQLPPHHLSSVPETNSSSSPANLSVTQCNRTVVVCDRSLASENLDLETQLKQLGDQVIRLTCESVYLKTKLERSNVLENAFVGCDSKVQACTGLSNFCLLMILFNLVGPHLRKEPRSSLSKFQQLMLCLMKLKFNWPVFILADMFRVSRTTVSRTFYSVLDVMYFRMQPLVVWPQRDCLYNIMSLEFKKYFGNKITVIIDCFEVFVEKPASLHSRSQTFSMYKHYTTVKYLVGIAPQGVVIFVSKGWGEHVSDKHLTENCAFLDNLMLGDVILAERGFNIRQCCPALYRCNSCVHQRKISAFSPSGRDHEEVSTC